ncbi:MAG: nicotinate-nicotinamide nucleotide adenylyltransferase, partial [Flavobacteriales bacterium]|nr:nicotinate-nicotinamide nucleotide adenylyltransferase [Flavobacteriales bacterium]
LVISPQNPFKQQDDLLDESKRLRLVKRALDGHSRIKPCTFEFDLPRPSYTIDTMREMTAKHPEEEFFLIMGSDNLIGIEGWKEYKVLITEHELAVYPRPGYALEEGYIERLGGRITLTDAPQMDLSSTGIRNAIAEQRPCRFMMRAAVWREVERKGYYSVKT